MNQHTSNRESCPSSTERLLLLHTSTLFLYPQLQQIPSAAARVFHSTGPPDRLNSSSLHSPNETDLADDSWETQWHIRIYSRSQTFTLFPSPATAIQPTFLTSPSQAQTFLWAGPDSSRLTEVWGFISGKSTPKSKADLQSNRFRQTLEKRNPSL